MDASSSWGFQTSTPVSPASFFAPRKINATRSLFAVNLRTCSLWDGLVSPMLARLTPFASLSRISTIGPRAGFSDP